MFSPQGGAHVHVGTWWGHGEPVVGGGLCYPGAPLSVNLSREGDSLECQKQKILNGTELTAQPAGRASAAPLKEKDEGGPRS